MNIVVGQSGGPTAVINASLYGVIQESLHYGKIDKIYGMVNGIEGFLEDKLVELNKLSPISMQLLKNVSNLPIFGHFCHPIFGHMPARRSAPSKSWRRTEKGKAAHTSCPRGSALYQ